MARWFSTTLRPEIVYESLDHADIDGICAIPVDATITPDSLLGVTTVQISVDETVPSDVLNELVLIGYSACLVQEIMAVYIASKQLTSRLPVPSYYHLRKVENFVMLQ